MARARKGNIALIVGAALILIGAALLAYVWMCKGTASAPDPNPNNLAASEGASTRVDEDGFPLVDWDYWQSVNPDVIAWVSVPGTDLSLPICKASKNDPEFYLSHDVTGKYNIFGCPYLDSECSDDFTDFESLILGHHMDDGSMFSLFADYAEQGYFEEHRTILLQTPTQKLRLKAVAVDAFDAGVKPKLLDFGNQETFDEWWIEMLSGAEVVSDDVEYGGVKAFAFCTCRSSFLDNNDRAIVYAVEEERL